MEKKVTCNGDCERCIYPDCIATDAEIAIFDRKDRKAAKAKKSTRDSHHVESKAEKMRNANRKWREAHPDYHREWVKKHRESRKVATI